MGKFDGILICTDLDGTLFADDKSVSRENREAIEYFKREGGRFTFITGRMPYYASRIYRLVQPNAPFGCANGGGLYDGETGKYIYVETLSSAALELVEAAMKAVEGIGFQANTPAPTTRSPSPLLNLYLGTKEREQSFALPIASRRIQEPRTLILSAPKRIFMRSFPRG